MDTCIEPNCPSEVVARGWCRKHYQRWYVHGSPVATGSQKTYSLETALELRTRREGTCLIWTGSISKGGYATYNGKLAKQEGTTLLHRLVWMQAHSSIPKGIEIDHMCHTRNCVEISHLRLADKGLQARNHEGLRSDNTSGALGVNFSREKNKYYVRVYYQKVRYNGGYHHTFDEAVDAADALRRKLYGHEIEEVEKVKLGKSVPRLGAQRN